MADWDDVRRLALALPEAEEGTAYGSLAWKVKGKLFVWERPLRTRDRAELGDAAPEGPVVAARVEHEVAKRALVESEPEVYFTTAHFDGHPTILARLDRLDPGGLEELVTEAWLVRAPDTLARRFLDARG